MDKNGITLVALVMTVIILLILASIATYSGVSTVRSARLTAFTTELKIMQTEANNLYDEYKEKPTEIGKEITGEAQTQFNTAIASLEGDGISISSSDQANYRYFDQETIQNLGIEGVEGEFFVNIETRSVISYEGFNYENKRYYTLSQLPNGLYNVDYAENGNIPTFDIDYEQVEDGKWRVTISNIQYDGYIEKWYVQYQKDGNDYWNTSEDLSFIVTEDGKYTVKINNETIESETKTIGLGVPIETEVNESITELSQMHYGVIEVKFLSGTSYKVTDTPNEPILKDGMTAVYWNGTTEVNDGNKSNWYSYEAQSSTTEEGGTSRWANAKTTDGSYYVWIPRYAYRIIYFDSETHENEYRAGTLTEKEALANNYIVGYSDARGIVDKDGKSPSGISSQPVIAVDGQYFRVHPVFDGNVDEGGWDSKTTGFWVAKYEASRNDATDTSLGTGTIPKSIPGVASWSNTTIGNIFTYAKNTYGEDNTTLNSHLIKNSEWGAVAYLTDSKYGRNGTEISVNQYRYLTGSLNERYLTGAGRGEGNGTIYNSIYNSIKDIQKYNGDIGKLSSSTGNIYGIYDLSGGANEYIAGYINKGTDLSNGISFAETNGESDKYTTCYFEEDLNKAYITGDATYETKNWNDDYKFDTNIEGSFFSRSGSAASQKEAGLFGMRLKAGEEQYWNGFRVCLTIEK